MPFRSRYPAPDKIDLANPNHTRRIARAYAALRREGVSEEAAHAQAAERALADWKQDEKERRQR